MGLFRRKKKEVKGDCCGGNRNTGESFNVDEVGKIHKHEDAMVKVLGSGCKKCNDLEIATKSALEQLGMDTHVDHVTDFTQIASYGVMTTPALVVKGRVVSYGKVLKTEEVIEILENMKDFMH